MGEYQATIDNIRSFLASVFQEKNDEVIGLAEDYAHYCKEANDRLRLCGEYLRKGLRAEAIHEAETAPNLLDMVAALDIPELVDWKEVCFRLELPEPPALLIDTAAALNEAYAQEQPLEGLMAHHRLLAIARAPLKNRLQVMRRIAELDPASVFWDDDIRLFERSRLDQIPTEIQQHARMRDLQAVRELQQELSAPSWRSAIPPELSRSVDYLSKQLQSAAVEAELRDLLPSLDAAYSAMSFDECRSILGRWLAMVAQANLVLPSDLQEWVAPIQQWVLEQQESQARAAAFQVACDILQQAIDTRAPEPQLETAYCAVINFRMELPAELEKRYQRRAKELATAAKHRRRMIYSGIGSALLIAAGAIAAVSYQKNRSREIGEVVSVLSSAREEIEHGNLDHGLDIAKQVMEERPSVAQSPTVVRALADLKSAAAAEHARLEEFKQHMQLANAAGVEHPDLPELARAEALAKTADEKRSTTTLRARINEIRAGRQVEIDDVFTRDAKGLLKQIDDELTTGRLHDSAEGYRAALYKLRDSVGQLAFRQDVSPALKGAQISTLNVVLKQKQQDLEAVSEEQRLLQRVVQATTVDDHTAALRSYIAKMPSSSRSTQFAQAADAATAEHAVEAWGHIVEGWGGKLSPSTAREAVSRIEQIKTYLNDHSRSPFAKELGDYTAYLSAGIQAVGPDGPWKKSYRDLLLNPLVHDLKMMETRRTHRRYYVRDNPDMAIERLNEEAIGQKFEAVLSSNLSKLGKIHLNAPDLLISTTPANSPQSEYAAAMLTQLNALDFDGWDSFGARAIDSLLRKQEMDVILKAILLENLVRLSQSTLDWTESGAISKRVADGLVAQNIEDIEWLNPDKPPSDALKRDVMRLIGQMPDTKMIAAQIEKHRQAIFSAVPPTPAIAGSLLRTDDGWRIEGPVGTSVASVAYAIDASGKLVELAHHQGNQWKFDTKNVQGVPEGSLVFIASVATR